MDTKNVIAAISLSAAVIILYSLFFAPAVVEQKDIQNDNHYYVLSREDRLSSDHRMYKQGYKFICYYEDTNPNAKIKIMDFYSEFKCPKSRNY